MAEGSSPRPRADQFAGALVGQCLGDALGFTVEGGSPAACRRYVRERLRVDPPRPQGHGANRFGQYTDDSQLARELMRSLVDRNGWDPEDYAFRIARIFATGEVVGPGQATTQAAARLANGVPWSVAGTPAPSAGNGSAMRAVPVGLRFHSDPQGMVRVAAEQGSITHHDPRCSAGAVAVAGAAALALYPGPIAIQEFTGTLAAWVEPFHAGFAGHLYRLPEWVGLPPNEAVIPISQAGMRPAMAQEGVGITPFVIGSVLWSLYAFLRSPDDYWETVCTAIEVGGDVDTTAAIAGGICGARLGIGAVPPALAGKVSDRGTWHPGPLVDLAHACHRQALEGMGGRCG